MKAKKLVGIVGMCMAGLMALSACQKADATNTPSETKTFKIGINQLAEHPALDAVRTGFEDELKKLGVDAQIEYKNAQGDVTNSTTISQKFASDGEDLIFAIATISAQSAQQATDSIPVLFSAVTDPVGAELVESWEYPGKNVSGTSDASPVEKQIALFKQIKPEIKRVGILFNTSEPNSAAQIEQATQAAEKIGIEIVTVGVNSINDLPQAIDVLTAKVEGIYTITDNMVASSINLVAETATKKGLITIGAEEAHVAGGMLMTDGLSYEALGRQTAQMAKRILVDKEDISAMSVETLQNTNKIVNTNTMNALQLKQDNTAFAGAEFVE